MRLETLSFVTFDEGDGDIPQLLRESTHGLGLLRCAPDMLARLALEHGIGRRRGDEDTDGPGPDFDEAKKLCVAIQSGLGPFPLPLLEKVLAIQEAIALSRYQGHQKCP